MNRQINLIKNNDIENLTDMERVEKFYDYLREDLKLSPKKAFHVIYYLQEHLPVFPDQIEQCSVCKSLYDSYSQGHHSEVNDKFYCYGCEHLAPADPELLTH